MLAFSFGSVVAIPLGWASFVALFIPVVTALITRFRGDNTKIHTAIALVLAGLLAVWAMLTDDIPNDTALSVFAAFLGVVLPSLASYLTVARPLNLNAKLAPTKGV